MNVIPIFLILSVNIITGCEATLLRLRGPLSENGTGRLEVFYNGTWGTICDDLWNKNAAKVACRQLGYNYSRRVLAASDVPDGSGQIWLDDVNCEGTETDLEDCTHNGWGKEDCNHEEDVGVECSATEVLSIRLQGPYSASGSGRVEVYHNGQWGTVCHNYWGKNDANVACRELGYLYASRVFYGYQVPDGTGQIWLDNVHCTGTEQSLGDCSHRGWGVHNCRHSDDAGVQCSSTDVDECSGWRSRCVRNARCINTPGSYRCQCKEGFATRWFSCDDINECSRYSSKKYCHSRATCTNTYGSYLCTCERGYTGDGTVCNDIDECSLSIDNCHPNATCVNIDGSYLCTCESGTVCREKSTAVRLRGPNSRNGSGRVEIYYNGMWGTICDDFWDMNDAKVACRDLGYEYAGSHYRRSKTPEGTGQIWLNEVSCTGDEQRLSDCSHRGWGNTSDCAHFEDAGVECSSTAVTLRLQGPSSSRGTGRVEIFYNGQWGTVCDDSWSLKDAEVACRQLGYHYAIRALSGYRVPDGSGPILLDNVGCTGNEQTLTSCSHSGVGIHDCDHSDDAGVECSATALSLRLIQSRSGPNGTGRIEVFHKGQWGTICDNSWSIDDATVACRQLGFFYAIRALPGYLVDDGYGQIWLNDVGCNGREQTLSSCYHSGWGVRSCRHRNDAGIECSTTALSLRLQGPLSKNGIGRLEVFHKGQWGTICDNFWSKNDAKVACRQLGYKYAVKVLTGHQVPDGSGEIWLSDVVCTGREKGLGNCNHRGWGVHNCHHDRDAGVECSEDLDECTEGYDNCSGDSQCINTVGSFTCICQEGYSWNGRACIDIDECGESNSCHGGAQCNNTEGSYNCTCRAGFTGNGQDCNNINECRIATDECDRNASCIDNEGSYSCQCRTGFYGTGFNCFVSPTLTFANPLKLTVREGKNVVLTVRITGTIENLIFAKVTASPATANETDYTVLSSSEVHFHPGFAMDKIVIETVDDSIKEENEVFVVTLSTTNPNVQIDKGLVMTITIIDNDDVETSLLESKDSSSTSNGSNGALIGGLIVALVFLVIIALLTAAYCIRQRKRGLLAGDYSRSIDEFRNTLYVGRQSCSSSNKDPASDSLTRYNETSLTESN